MKTQHCISSPRNPPQTNFRSKPRSDRGRDPGDMHPVGKDKSVTPPSIKKSRFLCAGRPVGQYRLQQNKAATGMHIGSIKNQPARVAAGTRQIARWVRIRCRGRVRALP